MQIPTARRIWGGVLLLCFGFVLFPGYQHWVRTRTWVAVDTPISLAPGHVMIRDFRVNLGTVYQVEIKLDDYEYIDCRPAAIRTRWWLYRGTRVVANWKQYWEYGPNGPIEGTYLGTFDSSHGVYTLDIEIVSGGTCLQAFHPRLRVFADESDYVRGGGVYAMALLVSWALIGISVAFLAVGASAPAKAQEMQGERLAIFDTLRTELESSRRKLLIMEPASNVPTFGYVYALTFSVLLLLCGTASGIGPRSYGIPVRVLRPGVIRSSTDRTTGPLVYVEQNGNLYLNSKAVMAKELARALEAEFAPRTDWSVYVDGDSAADFADVVHAMDLVRRAGGKVILLTPKMRAEADARRKMTQRPGGPSK